MLEFNVAQLLREPVGTSRTYEIAEERYKSDDIEVKDLKGKIRLTRLRGEVLLQGWIAGEVVLECSRCLEPYVQQLRIDDLELEFRPRVAVVAGDAVPPEPQEEKEDEFYWIDEHHVLDLQEPIREQVILHLPMQPLCRVECAGICPVCGVDLNHGFCPGHEEEIDARLAVLAGLLSGEESLE